MKIKRIFICTAVILQMCIFAGCDDDKSKETSEKESSVSVSTTTVNVTSASQKNETKNSDTVADTDNVISLPEIEITDTTSEMSTAVTQQPDKTDTVSGDKNTTVTTTKTPSKEETTTTVVTTAPDESVTTATTTKRGVIELPEVPFD